MARTADADFGNPADYAAYLRAEWDQFSRDDERQIADREAVAGVAIGRVLDIGCGAGQQMRPFVADSAALGVGVDVAPEAGIVGRALFASTQPRSRVVFVRAAAEHLPFCNSAFDLIVCRLALPYTDNPRALAEMARVLNRRGALLLTFHHARFYLIELRQALTSGRWKHGLHACRVLTAGLLYHLTGRQPRNRLTGGETFQTLWFIRRQLGRHGLVIQRVLPDSVPAAPSLLISHAPVTIR